MSTKGNRPPMGQHAVNEFINAHRVLCPNHETDTRVEKFAERLRWTIPEVQAVAGWLVGEGEIDVDGMGMGMSDDDIWIISGPDGVE